MCQRDDADWSREMRGHPLLSSAPLHNWVLMSTERDHGSAIELYEKLQSICVTMHMSIDEPHL